MKKIIVLCLACLCASNLFATLCSFDRITSNSNTDITGQLKVQVSNAGQVYDATLGQNVNKATFKFINNGPVASSISEIYFYDGSLLNMYSIDDSYGTVDFKNIGANTNPAELPGFNPDPSLLVVLSATQADNPSSQKGVKPGEWVAVGFTLLPGRTFQDLLTDLASGEVVVGIHVKAIAQAGSGSTASDSFITMVPEPATMAILGLGSLLLLRKRRV